MTRPAYDSAWQKVRRKHITAHPMCDVCGGPGRVVDHIVTVRKAAHRRLDPTNLQTMCLPCHSRATQNYDMGKPARGAGASGFPLAPDHPWYRADDLTDEDRTRFQKGKPVR